eukprot:1144767-Pelagomonas_calceolata.AAC.2
MDSTRFVAHSSSYLCGEHDASNGAGVHQAVLGDLGRVDDTSCQQVLDGVVHGVVAHLKGLAQQLLDDDLDRRTGAQRVTSYGWAQKSMDVLAT